MGIFKTDNEQNILSMFRRDESAATELLYKEYAPYLTGLCARYIADDDALKDVLQEAFIKIYRSIGKFRYKGKGSLKAWVSRIAVNECLQYLRKEKKGPSPLPDDVADLVPEEEPSVEGLDYKTIVSLIRKLPEGYRAVFNLYAIEGKSHKEIAELLHIKEDSSASQYHRAKNMLARMISKMKEYER